MSKRAFPTRRTDRSVSALFRGRQSKERQKKTNRKCHETENYSVKQRRSEQSLRVKL